MLERFMQEQKGLKEFAKRRGWRVEEETPDVLVAVVDDGILGCMDGRTDGAESLIEKPGPKFQGGLYGLAALLRGLTDSDIEETAEAVRAAGFQPGVHGNCGWEGLAKEGRLKGVSPFQVYGERLAHLLHRLGIHRPVIEGTHTENRLRVNRRRGTTAHPDGTAFQVDVWFAEEMGIPPEDAVGNAFDTIEGLGGEKTVSFLE